MYVLYLIQSVIKKKTQNAQENNISFTHIFQSFWEAHYDEEEANNDLHVKRKYQSILRTVGHRNSEL